MGLRLASVLSAAVVAGVSACSPLAPASGPTPEEDVWAEARAAIGDRPDLPGEPQLLPDVRLISFEYQRTGQARRDTIRGVVPVSLWLQSLDVRGRQHGRPLVMTLRDILVCEGALVERGRFPIPGRVSGLPPGAMAQPTGEYLALWRPTEDGWKLADIQLSPPLSVHVSDLATGCSAAITRRTGVAVGVEVGIGGAADLAAVRAAASESGYTRVSSDGFGRPEFHIRASVPLGPVLGATVWYGYMMGSEVRATVFTSEDDRALSVGVTGAHTLTVLAEARVGAFRLGAGPAWVSAGLFREYTATSPGSVIATSDAETLTRFGAAVEASMRVPVRTGVTAVGTIGYTHFPELEPESVSTVPIGLRGFGVLVGMEYTP